ncbi:MAG TPA: DUF1015 domain-containing protein [Candidatus Binataceae bacterium]|nr:DUF1015 domain-containing protein [Candidatus Binataceae bacterium]
MSAAQARVEPFRGFLFNPKIAGDLTKLVAPPYDLIGTERQNELYDRSPYNIIRLEYGREADRYSSAKTTLDQWIRTGVLSRPERASIYQYTQRFEHAGGRFTRTGYVLRFRLEEFGQGRVLPHERTFPAAKEDRLRLLTMIETNTSSIFGLYTGNHAELEQLGESVKARAPLFSVRDDLGIDNELRVIDGATEIATLQRALEKPLVLIADGHHRYETALNYQRARRAGEQASGTRPYDFTLMTLVSCNDPGLVILPTHRVVKALDPSALASFETRAKEIFEVTRISDSRELLANLARRGHGGLAVALKGAGNFLLALRDRAALDAALPDAPREVRELDVSILHALVFDRIFGIKADEVRKGGNIEYTIDSAGAYAAVAEGRADGAFLMNPPTIDDVERVSLAGATMPQKSTYFFPKLLTGLVMNPLCD